MRSCENSIVSRLLRSVGRKRVHEPAGLLPVLPSTLGAKIISVHKSYPELYWPSTCFPMWEGKGRKGVVMLTSGFYLAAE